MKKGFALVEVLIVTAIVGILAAIAIPRFMKLSRPTAYPDRPVTEPAMPSVHFPAPSGWVVDEAGKLSGPTVKELNAKSEVLAANDGPEIAVVTVQSMGGESVEQYSMHLAERWKVGKRASDNGVILLVALAERKIRIEVGTGLEPKLTDSQAKRIIDESITPALKRGDFDGGIKLGYERIAQAIQ